MEILLILISPTILLLPPPPVIFVLSLLPLHPYLSFRRDEVEAALLKEVEELELTISRLSSAAEMTRDQIQKIKSTRVSLQHDINLKAKTLLLDEVEVLGLRSSVKIDTH